MPEPEGMAEIHSSPHEALASTRLICYLIFAPHSTHASHELSRSTAGIPLQAHVEELRRRCEAVAGVQGCPTHYLEEIRLFREYAGERGLFFKGKLAVLSRPPDEAGDEHEVWFQEESNTYIKVSLADRPQQLA